MEAERAVEEVRSELRWKGRTLHYSLQILTLQKATRLYIKGDCASKAIFGSAARVGAGRGRVVGWVGLEHG